MNTGHTTPRASSALLIAVFFTWASCFDGYAQRTMDDQNHLTVRFQQSITNYQVFGGGFSWGRYDLHSFWETGVCSLAHKVKLSNGGTLPVVVLEGEGTYMHRLVCNRSRSFSLYGGGGLFIGYEFYDPTRKLPDYIDTSLEEGAFIYGLKCSTEAEIFITRQIAVTIRCTAPLAFSSIAGLLNLRYSMGIRLNI